jgi:signal transduction histidine kinase
MVKVLSFLLLATTLLANALELPLRSIESLRSLSQEEAAKHRKVEIEGTVLFVYSKHSAMVIHDGTGSCWVGTSSPLNENIKYGSKVRVTGQTYIHSSYLANIEEATAEYLGEGSIPEPRVASAEDLFAQWIDTQWIQIEALVVGTEEDGLAFTLVLDIAGKIFKADVTFEPDSAKRAAVLMQRRVLFTGVAGTVVNDSRQMTDRHFLIPSFDQIIPIETKTSEVPPPFRKIANLLQSDNSQFDAVKVEGVVTQNRKGRFFLRDETASTVVYTFQEDIYPPGSRVVVDGYPGVAPFRPILRATKVELSGKAETPMPLRLNPQDGIQPNLHNEFVELDCEFLGTVRAASKRTILQCRSGNTFFESNWTKSDTETSAPEPGDTIRLRGIYEVTTISPIPRIEWANGFRMHLLDNEAVEILKKAPWWTFNRLLWALGIAMAVILLILVWTNFLRRRVAIQTKIISRQVERSAIKDERQRIARELHDTLEQDLTGLSMQLENALDEIGELNEPANRSLSLVHRMLQRSRLEAHASVSDLRNPQLLMRPMAEAMKESLEEKAREAGVHLDFSVEGEPRVLRSTTQNHLLRIAREALNNALRHGKASRVHCLLAYTEGGVTLKFEDNGSGFDTSLPTPAGHFGLTGMRERANKIHARFSLNSSPGHGTKIEVHMPYTSPEAGIRERKLP